MNQQQRLFKRASSLAATMLPTASHGRTASTTPEAFQPQQETQLKQLGDAAKGRHCRDRPPRATRTRRASGKRSQVASATTGHGRIATTCIRRIRTAGMRRRRSSRGMLMTRFSTAERPLSLSKKAKTKQFTQKLGQNARTSPRKQPRKWFESRGHVH